jgi:hypothetical protein
MIKSSTLILLGTFLVAGCSQGSGGEDTSTAVKAVSPVEEAILAAEQALAEAEARRNVWSRSDFLLQSAKSANAEGRAEEALELATEARLQAELAIEQADSEQEAWRTRVLSE